jgi:antitoxin CptB
MMSSIDRNRLQWKCRRGLLELDLVLERYVKTNPQDAGLSELLDLPDNDLWDIVCGRSDQYAFHLRETVARLRAA